jgi:nucleoside-diphosphate-sugar epimerase
LGETVFGHALTGRTAQVMGDPDQLHSYSYTPDVAAALIRLGTERGAAGSVWHLPIADTRTTRQIVDHVYQLAGHKPRALAAGRTTLRLLGLIKPAMREYRHTLYQFTQRWVVEDRRYRDTFGDHTTPMDDAVAATLAWYRQAAAPASQQPAAAAGRHRSRRTENAGLR